MTLVAAVLCVACVTTSYLSFGTICGRTDCATEQFCKMRRPRRCVDVTHAAVEDAASSDTSSQGLQIVPDCAARQHSSTYERTEFQIEKRVLPPTTLGKGARVWVWVGNSAETGNMINLALVPE